jgi:hypothetical protein
MSMDIQAVKDTPDTTTTTDTVTDTMEVIMVVVLDTTTTTLIIWIITMADPLGMRWTTTCAQQ